MKILKRGLLVLSLGLMTPFLASTHATVYKNPVDLTPTAVQQSGATYGPNVVTENNSTSNTSRPTSIVTRQASADTLYTEPAIDNKGLFTNMPEQQAQQVASNSSNLGAWIILLLTVLLIGGSLYVARRGESDAKRPL